MQKGCGVASAHTRLESWSPAKSTTHTLLRRVLVRPRGLNTAIVFLLAGTVSQKCTKKTKNKKQGGQTTKPRNEKKKTKQTNKPLRWIMQREN